MLMRLAHRTHGWPVVLAAVPFFLLSLVTVAVALVGLVAVGVWGAMREAWEAFGPLTLVANFRRWRSEAHEWSAADSGAVGER